MRIEFQMIFIANAPANWTDVLTNWLYHMNELQKENRYAIQWMIRNDHTTFLFRTAELPQLTQWFELLND